MVESWMLYREYKMKSLNVKDPEAHRLATAIAQETGETMTRVVTEALRERFERLPNRRGKAAAQRNSAQLPGAPPPMSTAHTWTMRTSCTMKTASRNDSRHFRPGRHLLWRA